MLDIKGQIPLIDVMCPKCGSLVFLSGRNVARQVKCSYCPHHFRPARDVQIKCPECGPNVVMRADDSNQTVSCPSCGLVLPKPRHWHRRWLFWLLLPILGVLTSLAACQR